MNQFLQRVDERAGAQLHAQPLRLGLQAVLDGLAQRVVFVFIAGKFDVDHRVFLLPIPMIFYPKPFEQFPASRIQLPDRRQQQGLAEAARAGEEKISPTGQDSVNVLRLIHVYVSFCADFRKVLYADGVLHGPKDTRLRQIGQVL